jgi:hypothetical protein
MTVIVVLIAGAVARVGTREVINYAQSSPSAIEEQFEAAAADNPSLTAMFSALRDHYPEEYERLLSGVSEKARSRADGEEITLYAHNFMRSFTKSTKGDFAAAPQQALIDVLEEHVFFMEMLSRESDSVCAQFVTTGLSPGQRLSAPTFASLAEVVSLQIQTAAAGRDNPVSREPPTDADWQQVGQAMLNDSVSEAELDSLANETYSSLPVDRQCEVGKALYRAMASLPPEGAARMAAFVLIPD